MTLKVPLKNRSVIFFTTQKTNFVKLSKVEHLRLAIHWLVSQFYKNCSSGTFFSFYGEMMLNNRGIEQYIVTDTFLKTKMLCVPTQVQGEPPAAA